jgi:hypothetical protein
VGIKFGVPLGLGKRDYLSFPKCHSFPALVDRLRWWGGEDKYKYNYCDQYQKRNACGMCPQFNEIVVFTQGQGHLIGQVLQLQPS